MHKAILLLKKIPKGRVATYKEMARVCKTSPRAIGKILANNEDPSHFPCYKVVSSKGELCGYSAKGGPPAGKASLQTKKKLLEKDGIALVNSKVPTAYFWYFKSF